MRAYSWGGEWLVCVLCKVCVDGMNASLRRRKSDWSKAGSEHGRQEKLLFRETKQIPI